MSRFDGSISSVSEVTCAFLLAESSAQVSDLAPSVFDVAFLGHAHPVFDLGEGLFDGIEVGGIGRQEPEPGTDGFDGVADGLGFVTAQVVHDDDVSGLEGLDEKLFDISQEAHAVDRAVEDAGCCQPVASKCCQEGHGAPVPMRREVHQAFSLSPPATQRRHIGLDPSLINEDEAFGIKPALPGFPTLPPAGDRRAGLLKGEQGFF